nr:unnamed protein product [Callosobruchus analis]
MLVNVVCILVVTVSLSSAQYIPSSGACLGTFTYVFEHGEIIGEVRIPYDPVAAVTLISINLEYAQNVPNPVSIINYSHNIVSA